MQRIYQHYVNFKKIRKSIIYKTFLHIFFVRAHFDTIIPPAVDIFLIFFNFNKIYEI